MWISTLSEEILIGQKSVVTDSYQMSIGEVVNLYKDSELIINPNFQRLFRWEPGSSGDSAFNYFGACN
jgi:hypothetical protein